MAEDGIWFVRAGRGGRDIDEFRDGEFVAIGWQEIPVFSVDISSEDLKSLFAETYQTASPQKVANGAGQILRFLREPAIGDAVTTYNPDQRVYLLGRIAGSAGPATSSGTRSA